MTVDRAQAILNIRYILSDALRIASRDPRAITRDDLEMIKNRCLAAGNTAMEHQ